MIQLKSGIVWLASYPRSGNTWARMFLFNLTQILTGATEEQDINALPKFSPWDGMNTEIAKYLEDPRLRTIEEIASIRHRMHRDLAGGRNGLVFVKTHWLLGNAGEHSTINSSVTAGAIYFVRNPLDVAISVSQLLDKPVDSVIRLMGMANAVLYSETMNELLGSWSQNVQSWTAQPTRETCVLRYEDMLNDPEVWFRVLSSHIFDPAPTREQVRLAIDRSSFRKLKAQEEKHGFLGQSLKGGFFREGRAGQWKDVLTPQQIDRIIRDHREQMRRFGYLPIN
jgi:Sulfotransferase domain